jgi:hypothetical protein
MGVFMKEWLALHDSRSGERGLFSRKASQAVASKFGRRDPEIDYGTNPCCEIILRPYQFCNLSEVVVRATDTPQSLTRKVRLATILGTLQSTLSDFRYLNKRWKKNTEEERLLGVSLTGIMDNKILTGMDLRWDLPTVLANLRLTASQTNMEFSEILDIDPSAAITCVKPSGCTSLDTVIKTTSGPMSMAEIFEASGLNPLDHDQGTWLVPHGNLGVYDENGDVQLITGLYVNGVYETYDLTDEQGNTYSFTAEHKVLVKGKGWTRVDALVEGDDVVTLNSGEAVGCTGD